MNNNERQTGIMEGTEGVITVATAGNPPLYTVTGYNSNGTKWGLVCTIKELRKRH